MDVYSIVKMNYKNHKQYRLPGYDYSSNGNYFVTICTQNRINQYLGKISNSEIYLSGIGKTVDKIWNQIPIEFPGVLLDTYQIMPDHFHAIIRINKTQKRDLINQIPTFKSGIINNPMELKEKSLGYIIRWFKGKVKYEAGKIEPDFKWQSRFYERIIRNDREFFFIQEYIINNPKNYELEKNPEFEDNEITNLIKNV
ncbi:MAG: transposase [Ignavibacteriaceae bacterium]